jgi:hypothetical protein
MAKMTTSAALICTALLIAVSSIFGTTGALISVMPILGIWLLWLIDWFRARGALKTPDLLIEQYRSSNHPSDKNRNADQSKPLLPTPANGSGAQAHSSAPISPITVKVAGSALEVNPEAQHTQATLTERESPNSTRPARRPPRPTAEDFERHLGKLGWLYAARNPLHREGLYKLGQTVNGVADRMNTLNKEFCGTAHAGEYCAVFDVPVLSAYGDEQRLFAMLKEYRVSNRCEFFMLPEEFLKQAMDEVAAESRGDSVDTLRHLHRRPAVPAELALVQRGAPSTAESHLKCTFGGLVAILRNEAYRPGIYRLGYTAAGTFEYKARLDAEQRRHTSQIGFFSIIETWLCRDPRGVLGNVFTELKGCRLGRSSFIDISLERLKYAIERSVQEACVSGENIGRTTLLEEGASLHPKAERASNPPLDPPEPRGLMEPDLRPRPAPGEPWFLNTCPHQSCLHTVRAAGPDGTIGGLRCGSCGGIVGYQIEGAALNVWRESL